MQLRDLGRTGVQVSPLCLGTMMFGARATAAESEQMISRALDAGLNFVDTANIYAGGESEKIVGAALAKDSRRHRIVLATKFRFPVSPDDPNAQGASRRHIISACEDSLRRLQTDWIDLYQIHRAVRNVPIDETLRALDDLVRSGKVRYLGTSGFPGWQIVESLWASKELGLHRFVCEQPAYSLLDRTAERETIPAAQSFGMGVIPWSPLAGGLLTGKYQRGADTEGRWQGGRDFAGRRMPDTAFDAIEAIAALAADKGCSPAQLSLAWCASQPGVTAPIIGPRTLEQLEDNLGAAEVRVNDADRERLDAIVPPRSVTVTYYDNALGVDFGPRLARW